LIVTAAAVLVLSAGNALGQGCGHLNLIFMPDAPSIAAGDPLYDQYVPQVAAYYGIPVADFEWCWTQRVSGTIRGTWVTCGGNNIAIYGPFGLPNEPDLFVNPGILITKKGDIYTLSYGLSRYEGADWVSFGGVTWYGDGTGIYAGANGWGSDCPKHYPPSFWIESRGFLCTADSHAPAVPNIE
jgi:hypothetical protein